MNYKKRKTLSRQAGEIAADQYLQEVGEHLYRNQNENAFSDFIAKKRRQRKQRAVVFAVIKFSRKTPSFSYGDIRRKASRFVV